MAHCCGHHCLVGPRVHRRLALVSWLPCPVHSLVACDATPSWWKQCRLSNNTLLCPLPTRCVPVVWMRGWMLSCSRCSVCPCNCVSLFWRMNSQILFFICCRSRSKPKICASQRLPTRVHQKQPTNTLVSLGCNATQRPRSRKAPTPANGMWDLTSFPGFLFTEHSCRHVRTPRAIQ